MGIRSARVHRNMKTVLIESLQKAIREEGLDGWFFCNFRHRDSLSDEILQIGNASNSRYWFYAVPANGEPLKIIHSVEPEAINDLPGKKVFYVGRDELVKALEPLAGKTWGVNSSEELAAVSYLEAGMAAVLKNAGLRLVSAASLIQRVKSLLDDEGIACHERAAVHLYEIVNIAWDFVRKNYNDNKTLFEGDIQRLMMDEMEKRDINPNNPAIIAAGINSGNPHYSFSGRGAQIREGDIIQFDLWAKEKQQNAVYADISWAGVYAKKTAGNPVQAEAEKRFETLIAAREGAVSFINDELAAGRKIPGASVDIRAREIIESRGYAGGLKHRTGHGIDTEIHGSGVNIDSIEFRDTRCLLEGSCFSIEPGIYFSDFGMRTEIDVYIHNNRAHVSGNPHKRQSALLYCG